MQNKSRLFTLCGLCCPCVLLLHDVKLLSLKGGQKHQADYELLTHTATFFDLQLIRVKRCP